LRVTPEPFPLRAGGNVGSRCYDRSLDGENLFELESPARAEKVRRLGLSLAAVLLVPAESSVLPNDVATATRFTRTIALEIPLVSAAMDTVTEARTAIALGRLRGATR